MIILFVILTVKAPAKSGATLREPFLQLGPIGTLFFLPSIVCLLLASQWGGVDDPWNDVHIMVLFVLAGLLLIPFVVVQIWKQEAATIPPRVLSQRSVASGFIYSLCNGAAMVIMV